jgi:hypothetical protein
MKTLTSLAWALVLLAIAGWVASYSSFGPLLHTSFQTHLLDWVMGALCLLWLLVILKVPWDLYFQALEVFFELQRAKEQGIPVPEGRAEYIAKLRSRLLRLSLGAHLGSALLVTSIAYFTRGHVGYYFAVFYLVSTVFRPAVAGYVYLSRKLRSIGEEAHYPRQDVNELRERLRVQEEETLNLTRNLKAQGERLQEETARREAETRDLRQRVNDISREFESAISRLTDNQEVIKGIQAFVRLIAQSTVS